MEGGEFPRQRRRLVAIDGAMALIVVPLVEVVSCEDISSQSRGESRARAGNTARREFWRTVFCCLTARDNAREAT